MFLGVGSTDDVLLRGTRRVVSKYGQEEGKDLEESQIIYWPATVESRANKERGHVHIAIVSTDQRLCCETW